METLFGLGGDDPGDGGFSHAGRAVEDHVGDIAAFNDAAQAFPRSQQVLLADYLVQSAGTQPVGKRRRHGRPSFSGSDTSIVPDFCRKVNRFSGKEPLTAVLQ